MIRAHEEALWKSALEPTNIDSDFAQTTFNAIDREGWSRLVLVVNISDFNDTDTVLDLELQSAATNVDSDLIAGAVSSDTFSWQIAVADAAEDEVHVADIDLSEVGITERWLRVSSTALNGADTAHVGITAMLYGPTGRIPRDQTNTVKSTA